MRGLVTEVARHAAAGSLDQLRLRAGDEPQHIEDWLHRAKGLLMAVAVHQQRLA